MFSGKKRKKRGKKRDSHVFPSPKHLRIDECPLFFAWVAWHGGILGRRPPGGKEKVRCPFFSVRRSWVGISVSRTLGAGCVLMGSGVFT